MRLLDDMMRRNRDKTASAVNDFLDGEKCPNLSRKHLMQGVLKGQERYDDDPSEAEAAERQKNDFILAADRHMAEVVRRNIADQLPKAVKAHLIGRTVKQHLGKSGQFLEQMLVSAILLITINRRTFIK